MNWNAMYSYTTHREKKIQSNDFSNESGISKPNGTDKSTEKRLKNKSTAIYVDAQVVSINISNDNSRYN